MKIVSKLKLISLKKCNPCQFHFIIYLGAATLLLVILYLCFFSNSIACSESTLQNKVLQICDKYYRNEYNGGFCHEICAKEQFLQDNKQKRYQCPTDITSPDVLFVGITSNGQKYLFRESNTFQLSTDFDNADNHNSKSPIDPIKWFTKSGKAHYPTEFEFLKMVNRTIFFRYNIALPDKELKNLLNFRKNGDFEILHNSMESLWKLIHDNDFMLSKLLDTKELFPKVIGNCGPYYAVEHIVPFGNEGSLERLSDHDWKRRLQRAVLILDFIEELDSNQPEPITMCDIKYNRFGISDNRLKYLDLEHVHATFFVDRYLSDSKNCWKDLQCSYKSCKSKCNRNEEKCLYTQLNNNVQIVCDKVFKGSTYSPGLLMTSRTPKTLMTLLDQCANPNSNSFETDPFRHPWGPAKDIRNALYIELTNIYDGLITV